ncbi:MAG TPA: hypothetical protein VGF45_18620 [Polyangia bacterium]
MPPAALFVVGVAFAAAGLEVEGNSRCPSVHDVRARVAEVVPADGDQPGNVLRVDETSRGVLLDLRTRDGRVIGQRLLARTSSCSDLAAAAAVVVGVWQGDGPSEFGPELDPAGVDLRAALPPRDRPRTFDLGVAGLWAMALAEKQAPAAPGLALAASTTFGRSGDSARWGLRATGTGTDEQELPLSPGAVHWRRLAAGLGPQLRLAPGFAPARPGSTAWRWHLDLNADARVAHLRVRGVGFATNRPSTSFEPGLGAGARLLVHRRKAAAYLDLSLVRWMREQVAVATGLSAGGEMNLPRHEALLSLGVGYCACP